MPIKVHATLPLGLLVFSGFRFVPLEWVVTCTLILLHELGHAWVVRTVGGRATEVVVHGFGGWCAWEGDVTALGRAAIACGGVFAQLLLLLAALALRAAGVWPQGFEAEVVYAGLTLRNAWLMGFNLLPFRPLDGAEAWAFPYLLGQRARRRLSVRQTVARIDADFVATDDAVSAQAKDLAARLLADARKPTGKDEP